jgi:hypothetical protein
MVMNRVVLKQQADGKLKAIALSNVSMNAVNGLWSPCAGERTPWNTHIGGEEYEPDARTYEHTPLTTMNRFLGTRRYAAYLGATTEFTKIGRGDLQQCRQATVHRHVLCGRRHARRSQCKSAAR